MEHKSSLIGCTANLINAIVGSGIVGIPYAILNAGFVAGIVLVLVCAMMTDKSLRLLIATAKHSNAPSYETLAEAAFGTLGFLFISINMFIMSYGAMLSYLMIIKDTFSVALGVDPTNLETKRAMLCIISLLIVVPLSSQRDMADLAATSRISVAIDALLVLLVVYQSQGLSIDRVTTLSHDPEFMATDFWMHPSTLFVGLGVLSFAFVCQHSAFILAGSLDRPTVPRWSKVTQAALCVCATLALLCGSSGYLGYLDNTKGNIINNLPVTGDMALLSNVARCLLGTTMLFVYPMESFVARHVCVVLLFEGRRAHEGEDASILSRRDRRIGLTFALYLSALIPAILFEDLGQVLAATGAVGGSSLSYIGPGAIYLGVHGEDFLALIRRGTWWRRFVLEANDDRATVYHTSGSKAHSSETTSLLPSLGNTERPAIDSQINPLLVPLQYLSWYLLLMPVWCWVARIGKQALSKHSDDMALKSPHPSRIGNVAPNTPQLPTGIMRGANSLAENRLNQDRFSSSLRGDEDIMARASSFRETKSGGLLLPPDFGREAALSTPSSTGPVIAATTVPSKSPSLNQQIGAKLLASSRQKQHQDGAIEKDPQKDPPNAMDFVIAVFFILFGVVALFAGLVSIGLKN